MNNCKLKLISFTADKRLCYPDKLYLLQPLAEKEIPMKLNLRKWFPGFLIRSVFLCVMFAGHSFCQSKWEWRYPQHGNQFNKIVYGNGQFVAMGQRTIASSPDGITWTPLIPEQIITMQDLAFGSNRFVAVGDSGKILSSTDGKIWSLMKMAEPTFFLCIAYGNDRFVAMGTGTGMESGKGICFTSPDGLTWTKQKQTFSSYIYNEVFGNSLFLAVCWGGNSESIYTSADGENWNYCTSVSSGVAEVTFVHDRFLIFSQYDQVTVAMTSFDGKDWTGILPSYTHLSYSGTYVHGQFIIQKSSGTALVSPDCTTWTERKTEIKTSPRSIAIGPTTIVGATSLGGIATSSNGISWTQQVAGGRGAELYSVAYGNGRFVAVEQYGSIVSSTDAIEWTWSDSTISERLSKIAFANNLFFAMGEPGKIFTSPDGLSWSTVNLPVSEYVEGIAYHDGLYVLAGAGIVFTSNDAITWTTQNPGMSYGFDWIAYVNERFLFNISNNWLLTSPDGVNWTKEKYNGPLTGITSIAYGNGKYIGVGFQKIVSSLDGSNWTVEDSAVPVNFINLLFCNNQFVAISSDRCAISGKHFVSDNNQITTSSDGIKWTSHNIGQYENLYAMAYGNGQFVAVGASGAILASRADDPSAVIPLRARQFGNIALEIKLTQKSLMIKLPNSVLHNKYNIQLTTISGRRISCALTRSINGVVQIPTIGLSSGVYYVLISNGSGQSFSSKFILTR